MWANWPHILGNFASISPPGITLTKHGIVQCQVRVSAKKEDTQPSKSHRDSDAISIAPSNEDMQASSEGASGKPEAGTENITEEPEDDMLKELTSLF